MDVPAEVLQQLHDLKGALDDLDVHMQPFLEAGPKQLAAQLTPLERARAQLCLAQAGVVLLQLHRRLAAAKPDSPPLQKELERLAKYERKVQQAVGVDELVRTKPGASLNIAAANRFIDAAIPDLSTEQKAALRALHKRGAPAAAAAAAGAGGSDADGGGGSGGGSGSGRKKQQPAARSSSSSSSSSSGDDPPAAKKHKQRAGPPPMSADALLQDVLGGA